jgi:hypothetical protein
MRKGLQRFLVAGIAVIVCVMLVSTTAQAALSATINVTVTIQNLSVSATGPIAFGTVTAASSTVSTDFSTVTNDGNVTETYSLNLTDPASWTSVTAAPGAEEYALLATFNSVAPVVGDFSYANHALTTAPVSCSGTQFAGDETGLSLAAGTITTLWLRFDAPTSTAVTTQQTIILTLTAAAG